jgi:hypothetical protein
MSAGGQTRGGLARGIQQKILFLAIRADLNPMEARGCKHGRSRGPRQPQGHRQKYPKQKAKAHFQPLIQHCPSVPQRCQDIHSKIDRRACQTALGQTNFAILDFGQVGRKRTNVTKGSRF